MAKKFIIHVRLQTGFPDTKLNFYDKCFLTEVEASSVVLLHHLHHVCAYIYIIYIYIFICRCVCILNCLALSSLRLVTLTSSLRDSCRSCVCLSARVLGNTVASQPSNPQESLMLLKNVQNACRPVSLPRCLKVRGLISMLHHPPYKNQLRSLSTFSFLTCHLTR